MTIEAIIAAARLGAIAVGCTCTPAITVSELSPGIFQTNVAHEDMCPLLLRRAREGN